MFKCQIPICVLAATVAVLCSAGCARKTRCNPDGTPSAESFAAHGVKPSEDEGKAFASKLEQAVAAGNAAEANACVDWDTLFDFATDTNQGSSQGRASFIKGAKNAVDEPSSLMGQLTAMAAQGANFKYLRCREQDRQLRVLFRLITPEGYLNYFEFIVLKYPDGVRAADIYTAAAGELSSQTVRKMFLSLLAADQSHSAPNQGGHDSDLADNVAKIKEMSDAVNGGDPRRGLAIYDSLPESIKGDKPFLLMRMKAIQSLQDDDAYRRVLGDFQKYYPNDPSLDLINIDHYFLTKQFDKLLEAVDRVDSAIGGDPYLNIFRANAFFVQGKIDEALRFARKASEAEKDLKAAYATELDIAISAKMFSDVARLLSIMERDFHQPVDALLQGPKYAAFKRSSEYAAWMKERN